MVIFSSVRQSSPLSAARVRRGRLLFGTLGLLGRLERDVAHVVEIAHRTIMRATVECEYVQPVSATAGELVLPLS